MSSYPAQPVAPPASQLTPQPTTQPPTHSSTHHDEEPILAAIVELDSSAHVTATSNPLASAAGSSAEPSAIERFLNNFLREENIKWMSVLGAAIVLASSLMLVTRQWTSWSIELKYLTIAAYTFAAYYSGNLARTRLGLKTSGRVLELLSLLLMPLCFIALGLLDHAAATGMPLLEKILLVVPALGLTYHASSRTFKDILRGSQPTFHFSYCALAAAGAIDPLTTPWAAALFVVVAWLVTSIGVIKVNRHIFWLTEEARQPRVFAFMPIALLGGMFIVLVATKALPMIALHWMGTVCVLFSVTILLTARSAAEVFKQRTGNLVRPLPWNLMAPLVIGLIVMSVGIAISCHGFSFRGPTTIAIVPTALLASGLLCLIAWDTGLSGFVWPALVLLTTAYQVSPVMFRSTLLQLRDVAASAMNEATLPLAFYGVTYMPLVGLLVAATAFCMRGNSNTRVRLRIFSEPMQKFAIGLMLILFVAALTNLKALAIVAAIDSVMLLAMAVALRERRYAWLTLACLVLCSVLLFPFGHAMNWWELDLAEIPTSVAALGFLLATAPGLDRLLARIPSAIDRHRAGSARFVEGRGALPVCITLGYCLAFFAAVVWSTSSVLDLPTISSHFIVQWALIAVTFFVATARTRDYLASLGFWTVMAIGFALLAATYSPSLATWTTYVSIGCASLTLCLALLLKQHRGLLGVDSWQSIRMNSILLQPVESAHRDQVALVDEYSSRTTNDGGQVQLLATLSVALRDLSLAIALCLATVVLVPASILVNAGMASPISPAASLIMTVWGAAMTALHRSSNSAAAMGLLAPLSIAACMFGWLPELQTFHHQLLLWTVVASIGVGVSSNMRASWIKSMLSTSLVWTLALSLLSLMSTEPIFRVVGVVAGVALAVSKVRPLEATWLTACAIYANVQALLLVMLFAGINGYAWDWILSGNLHVACALLLPAVAISALLFDVQWSKLDASLTFSWTFALRILAVMTTLGLFGFGATAQPWLLAVIVGATLLAAAEFLRAVRFQQEGYVWSGLVVLSIAVAWLVRIDVLDFGVGVSQVLLALASALGLLISHVLRERKRGQVFVRPMFIIGMVCPGVLAALAVFHGLTSAQVALDPIGMLTLFAAAFIYFHQSYVQKNRWLLLLSIVILNAAILLSVHGLQLRDEQFYCVPVGLSIIAVVQLLKRELPREAQDPLRYVGSLVVLVSPIFHIVDGSWLHLVSLLALCVLVVLLAIGLRVRALLNVGTAFLLADLVTMVIRSSIDHPSLLWVSGLGIGGAVILLAAFCERHREQVIGRIRLLSAELATWN